MILSRRARIALAVAMALGLAIIYVPLLLVLLNSVNSSRTFGFPPTGLTLEWWRRTLDSAGARSALWTSVKVGLGATAVALLLGTCLAFAVQRYRFFGRDVISLLVVLPIALPGIVTGIALNSAFNAGGVPFGYFTVIVAHATFCIVIVYNNVLARLRRTGTSLEEASADLGATTFQTFRYVTFPQLRSALVAAAVLAFALSFDEIIVTTFTLGATQSQTLPIWIFSNISRPNQLPIVYAVALIVILLSAIPVYLAQRLAGDAAGGGRT